jgi:ribosome-associated heat shock protein Hsp15
VPEGRGAPASVRLDVWLDVACLFRTRSEAQRACRGGKVHVNRQAAKPHREVRVGDALEITRALGRRQQVIIRALAERHLLKALARELYEDRTPPLSPEEVELRRLARLARAFGAPGSAGAPDKRQRRQLRRMRGKD